MKETKINVEELARTYGLKLPVSVHIIREEGDKPMLLIEEVE